MSECCQFACYEDPGCACAGCRSPRKSQVMTRLRELRCVIFGHAVVWGVCPKCNRRALG